MSFALVLGGGGSVGIAWEVGVLAALADAGLDLAGADVVVGSSAGSVVGTRLRQGWTIDRLRTDQEASADGGDARPTDLSPVIEIIGILRSTDERGPSLLRQVGAKAIAASTIDETAWVARFEGMVGDGGWPDGDLRITAVDCHTGTRRVWTEADGVPLAAALASSCAIPGVFPPVTLDDSRFTDGGLWSSSNLDVVLGSGVDAAVFVGPLRAGDPSATRALAEETERLESVGIRVESIVPGDAFADEIGAQNLMNPALRGRGLELGTEDGAAAAADVTALLA